MIGAKIATRRREDTLIPGGPAGRRLDRDISTTSASQAAKLLGVSTGVVENAKTVLRHGTKDQIDAVERGDAAVSTVAKGTAEGNYRRCLTERSRATLVIVLASPSMRVPNRYLKAS